ncbi:MAG: MinD/ParA family protein [Pseudomonadota bacterium]
MATVIPNSLPRPTRVIAVTSGKGGVGKTMVSINLSVALAQLGHRVTLLDADLGLANADVLLGLAPKLTLADVLDEKCALEDILLDGPCGIKLVPAASGVQRMVELADRERAGLMTAFNSLDELTDVLVIDTAAGIATNAMQFCEAAQEILVVTCNEPASITDAYATIKVLHQQFGRDRFRILVNQVNDEAEAKLLFNNLVGVTDRFLDVTLQLSGHVKYDRQITVSGRKREAIVASNPSAAAAQDLQKIAKAVDTWPIPSKASGKLEFFLESMIETDSWGRRQEA